MTEQVAHLKLKPYKTIEDDIVFVCQLCEDKTELKHAEVKPHFAEKHYDALIEGINVDDADPGYAEDAHPHQQIIDTINNLPTEE